jgi:transcriptional regulator with XRE-family HTH domain
VNLEILYDDIGKRIRDARAVCKITQEKLAEIAGLSIAHISHIETGNTKLSLPTIIKIANALNVTVDMLLCDNMIHSRDIYDSEISALVADCSEKEIRIITEIVKAIKVALRKNI